MLASFSDYLESVDTEKLKSFLIDLLDTNTSRSISIREVNNFLQILVSKNTLLENANLAKRILELFDISFIAREESFEELLHNLKEGIYGEKKNWEDYVLGEDDILLDRDIGLRLNMDKRSNKMADLAKGSRLLFRAEKNHCFQISEHISPMKSKILQYLWLRRDSRLSDDYKSIAENIGHHAGKVSDEIKQINNLALQFVSKEIILTGTTKRDRFLNPELSEV
jgi:hypothetical protein